MDAIAEQFTNFYYQTFDGGDRSALANLYVSAAPARAEPQHAVC
jgi:hypothetical protein